MKALILAAGYATRLYPLTKEYPKPLLAVGRRPIIDYIIDKLEVIDNIDEIIIVTNSKFIFIFKRWKAALKTKKRLTLVDDLSKSHADRRGAIGDLNFVIDKKIIKEDLLVIGGDNLFEGELKDFLSFAKLKKPYVVMGIYDIKDKEQAEKYGVVKLDRAKRIVDFKEKPKNPKSTLIAMCLYYFPKKQLEFVGEYLEIKRDKHDATGFFIEWLRKQEPIYGFEFRGHWFDIGHHNSYGQAKETFKWSLS
jgi:glucose-1-phosphate thymidylyltransferase